MAYVDIHPDHPIPDDVSEGIRAYREEKWRIAEAQFEQAKLARPSTEERQFKEQLHDSMLKAAGVDLDDFHATRLRLRKEQVERMAAKEGVIVGGTLPTTIGRAFRQDPPVFVDRNFWYANASWFADQPYSGSWDADGLSFSGMKNHDDGDLIRLVFGYTSTFELQANRVPHSASGTWRSAPHIEIFGALIGSSQDSFGFGDDWCKCWMIRRQTAFQFIFGPPGADNRRIIAEREDPEVIFFSEDAPFTGFWNGPGFQPMPELVLTHPFPSQSIWVELELRFDIQLEGSAQLWIDPQQRFVVRGFQWPAQPI